MDQLELWTGELNPDIIGVTETWADSDILDSELMLAGYDLFRRDRPVARNGGGVIMYIRSTLNASEYEPKTKFPEQVWCQLTDVRGSKFYVGVCYRTPTLDIFNGGNHDVLRSLLNELGATNRHFLLMGDFNYRFTEWPCQGNDGLTVEAESFCACLDDNFFVQHVTEPTRLDAILDLVVTDEEDMVDDVLRLGPLGSSDHSAVTWNVRVVVTKERYDEKRLDYARADIESMRRVLRGMD